jgi:hypothetical protein
MVKGNKSNVLAAAAGIVVGAGAAIAGAIAMNDKSNQKKVLNIFAKAKEIVKGYGEEVKDQEMKGRENIKKVAGKAIKSAELVTKAAKREVKKI